MSTSQRVSCRAPKLRALGESVESRTRPVSSLATLTKCTPRKCTAGITDTNPDRNTSPGTVLNWASASVLELELRLVGPAASLQMHLVLRRSQVMENETFEFRPPFFLSTSLIMIQRYPYPYL